MMTLVMTITLHFASIVGPSECSSTSAHLLNTWHGTCVVPCGDSCFVFTAAVRACHATAKNQTINLIFQLCLEK